MARDTAGILIKYMNREGIVQKGIARNIKQHPSFKSVKKIYLELCNDDLTPKMSEGKRVVALVEAWRCQDIGFVD